MDRGYERFEEKLRSVGAQIQRMGDVFAPRPEKPVPADQLA
jgi:UDP-N-acetylglucosamine 1-carboxyvinyltransferase